MSTRTLDPRLQLVPAGTQPRLWTFGLCVLLPVLVTTAMLLAVKGGDTHWDFVGGDPLMVGVAIVGAEALLMSVIWALLDRVMHRHRLALSADSLEVKTSFYSQMLAVVRTEAR